MDARYLTAAAQRLNLENIARLDVQGLEHGGHEAHTVAGDVAVMSPDDLASQSAAAGEGHSVTEEGWDMGTLKAHKVAGTYFYTMVRS